MQNLAPITERRTTKGSGPKADPSQSWDNRYRIIFQASTANNKDDPAEQQCPGVPFGSWCQLNLFIDVEAGYDLLYTATSC